MSDHYILRGHEPIKADLVTWAKWLKTADRAVAKTNVGDVKISTVFLGLNHNFDEDGEPLIFETMIFGGKHDQDMERYSTWDEAEKGHAKFVEIVKSEQGA